MAKKSEEQGEAASKGEPSEATKILTGMIFWGIVAFGAYLFFSGDEPSARTEVVNCGTRAECVIEEHKISAQVACDPKVEDLGNYTARWTNSWYEPRYSHYSVDLEQENTLTMFGDSIEFQNGFGAWQRAAYVCVYNYATGEVLTVSGQAGRLDL